MTVVQGTFLKCRRRILSCLPSKRARSTSLLGLAALLLATLSGAPPTAAEEETVLRVWMMGYAYADRTVDGENHIGIGSIFRQFEAAHPGVKIEYSDIGWENTFQKIMTSMIGEGPDVYMLGSTWVGQFVEKETLEDLTPYIERDGFDFSTYYERYTKMAFHRDPKTGKERCWGLPWVADTRILAYDKQIFKHWGVEPPRDGMSWEELLQKAKATTGKDPVTGKETYGYMVQGFDPVFMYMGYLYQNGGSFYSPDETRSALDTPESREALKYLVDLHVAHNVSGPETMNNFLWNTFGPFLSPENKYSIYETVPSMVKEGAMKRGDRIGVCTLPVRKGAGGLMGGSFLAVNRKSSRKDIAFQFLKFMASEGPQKYLVEHTASLSPRNDLGEWSYIKEHPEWNVALRQFAASSNTPAASWEETYNIIGEYVQNALIGEISPDEAVAQMSAEIDHLLRSNAIAVKQTPEEITTGVITLNLFMILAIVLVLIGSIAWGTMKWVRENPGRSLSSEISHGWIWYLFIAPVVLVIAVFTLYPLFESLRLSFVSSDGINVRGVVGLDNYRYVLQSGKFWNSVRNTLYLACVELIVMLPLAIGLAVLINERVMAKTFFKVVYFMPVVTSYVAISIVWMLILNPGDKGILNNILDSIGLFEVLGIEPFGWISSAALSKPSLVIMDVWRWLGFIMIIVLAGLQSIPESLYEAAQIDGASAFNRFWHVTLPLLKPSITFIVLSHWINALQAFDQVFILGGLRGGVQRSMQTIVSYLYEVGFGNQHFGVASAIAYLLFFMIAIITGLNAWWLKPHRTAEQ